jgi:DNA-directed RNA polymerase, alpha subunit/40 kD subunit
MNFELIEKKGLYIKFKISGINPQLANLIRRVLIARTPTLAIDDVLIIDNTSVMYDEMLAHRIGLIPIKTDILSLKEDTTVNFRLEVTAEKDDVMVYSGDLKSLDPNYKIAFENIPICKLAKGQRIFLEAIARVKTGNIHARFQPVAACAYKQVNEDTFIFSFESTGIDEPEKILLKAIDVIISTYNEINKELQNKIKHG